MTDSAKKQERSAVSLQYDIQKNKAPRVTAKGKGLMAEKIIALALANNIPVKEDPDLVQLLGQIDLNREIPTELYKVVAELLSFVYKLNHDFPSSAR